MARRAESVVSSIANLSMLAKVVGASLFFSLSFSLGYQCDEKKAVEACSANATARKGNGLLQVGFGDVASQVRSDGAEQLENFGAAMLPPGVPVFTHARASTRHRPQHAASRTDHAVVAAHSPAASLVASIAGTKAQADSRSAQSLPPRFHVLRPIVLAPAVATLQKDAAVPINDRLSVLEATMLNVVPINHRLNALEAKAESLEGTFATISGSLARRAPGTTDGLAAPIGAGFPDSMPQATSQQMSPLELEAMAAADMLAASALAATSTERFPAVGDAGTGTNVSNAFMQAVGAFAPLPSNPLPH